MENTQTAVQDITRRVLVMDDEESIRVLLKEYFEVIGLEVETAPSGDEGLSILKKENFGLILCDVSMPGMDGFEVFEEVRTAKPDQKFLFISGYNFSEEKKDLIGKSLGLLKKPFHLNDLYTIISSIYPEISK